MAKTARQRRKHIQQLKKPLPKQPPPEPTVKYSISQDESLSLNRRIRKLEEREESLSYQLGRYDLSADARYDFNQKRKKVRTELHELYTRRKRGAVKKC